ncbi:hypothetical protein [Enterococcus alishanensis]
MNKLLKKEQRMRLLATMNLNNNWSNSTEELQRVQKLAEPLFTSRPPLPEEKLDWQYFKRSDFLFLLSLGYGIREITKIYKVSSRTLYIWQYDQGFGGRRKEEILDKYSDEVVKARQQNKLSDYGIFY